VGSDILFDPPGGNTIDGPGTAVFANVRSPADLNSLALFFYAYAGGGCSCGAISLVAPANPGQSFPDALGNSLLFYPNNEVIADLECTTDSNGQPDCTKLPPPRKREFVSETILGLNGTFVSGTPLPAALPLFATGLGAIGLLGLRRKRRGQENQHNLDAARIRTKPKVLPGLLAGVRAGNECAACDCIRQAHTREPAPCSRLNGAGSLASDRALFAFTQFGETFLRAGIGAHLKLALRRNADKLSVTRVSNSRRAENPEANSAQDCGPARNRAKLCDARNYRRCNSPYQSRHGPDTNCFDGH
jgi:hypothetical protein